MPETNGNKRPMTYDRLKSKKQATIRKIKLVMNAEIDAEYRAAEMEYGMAQMMYSTSEEEHTKEATAKFEAVKERYEAALKAALDDAQEFVFRSIGRKAFDALVDENPPTNEEIAEVEKAGGKATDLQWSAKSFPQELVAAASVNPKLTLADTLEMWNSEDWSFSDLNDLFQTAVNAQNSRRLVEMGNV